jgi:hypothetical protein
MPDQPSRERRNSQARAAIIVATIQYSIFNSMQCTVRCVGVGGFALLPLLLAFRQFFPSYVPANPSTNSYVEID